MISLASIFATSGSQEALVEAIAEALRAVSIQDAAGVVFQLRLQAAGSMIMSSAVAPGVPRAPCGTSGRPCWWVCISGLQPRHGLYAVPRATATTLPALKPAVTNNHVVDALHLAEPNQIRHAVNEAATLEVQRRITQHAATPLASKGRQEFV